MNGNRISRKSKTGRIQMLKWFFVIFAIFIISQAINIQLGTDPRLEKLAQRQFTKNITALPRRGLILDRNGEGLAISLRVHSLFVQPKQLQKDVGGTHKKRLIQKIAKIIQVPALQISQKLDSKKGFVWLKRQLSTQEEAQLKAQGVLDYSEGLGLVEETKRFYPNRELSSHVLGSVNVDGQGLEGLELYYNETLSGEKTRLASAKDAMGRRIFRDDEGILGFKDGKSLVLTIDKTIQYESEKALKNAIDTYGARSGSVLVADVTNGEILALANAPTFDSNAPKNSATISMDSRRNRALTDTYEPGSTFKPFIVGMALEKNKTVKSKVYCEKGSFTVGDRKISEAESHEKYEWLTLGEILKYSSNIGSAKLALELGPRQIQQLFERLKIGQKTGIDLPGEATGFYDKHQLSSQVRIANMGFGQGFTVTPLQMLTYYLALANGGLWVQPKIVKAVLSEDPDSLQSGLVRWKLQKDQDERLGFRIFNPSVIQNLQKMLKTVTEEGGTGVKAQIEEWPVAGKTGTAQKVDSETKKYAKRKYIVSFGGFAPSAQPKLVALVVLDEPKSQVYASETAAPTFKNVMYASLLKERVPALDLGSRSMRLSNKAAIERVTETDLQTQVSGIQKTQVSIMDNYEQVKLPDLRGLTLREVLRLSASLPIRYEVYGSGILKSQSPSFDEWIKPDTKVKLIFGSF